MKSFFSSPSITQAKAKELLQPCQVIPDQKPSVMVTRLSAYAEKSWTVLFKKDAKDKLRELTYHHRYKKETPNSDNQAARSLNNFLRNVRVFGFQKTRDAYDFNENKVRISECLPRVFHNHFGNHPVYIMEYQIDPEARILFVTKIARHENFPFQKKLFNLRDLYEENQGIQKQVQQVGKNYMQRFTQSYIIGQLHQEPCSYPRNTL